MDNNPYHNTNTNFFRSKKKKKTRKEVCPCTW